MQAILRSERVAARFLCEALGLSSFGRVGRWSP
jgi:hypothetical protein